jgi:hypothetical protein
LHSSPFKQLWSNQEVCIEKLSLSYQRNPHLLLGKMNGQFLLVVCFTLAPYH